MYVIYWIEVFARVGVTSSKGIFIDGNLVENEISRKENSGKNIFLIKCSCLV